MKHSEAEPHYQLLSSLSSEVVIEFCEILFGEVLMQVPIIHDLVASKKSLWFASCPCNMGGQNAKRLSPSFDL